MRSDTSREGRLKSLQSKIPQGGALLLTTGSDILYYSGFYSQGEVLLLAQKHRPVCFIDNMNRSLAETKLKNSTIKVIPGKGPLSNVIAEHFKAKGLKDLFLDIGNISVMFYKGLAHCMRGIKIKDSLASRKVRDVLSGIRAVKSDKEIALLRFLAAETVRIWRKANRKIRPGMTEVEIARMVDIIVREEGYENSFPTIVAAGANSAYPHAIPSEKRLGKKEHVMVDFGIRDKFYCSDLTRIWGECRINGQIRDLCESVREIQKKAIGYIGPGVSIKQTVKKVNDLFSEKGLLGFVMHSLGHGIGLDVHERPGVGMSSEDKFEKGMVVTVEPGLYVPGKGGARIEDMVLVTSKGREVLTI